MYEKRHDVDSSVIHFCSGKITRRSALTSVTLTRSTPVLLVTGGDTYPAALAGAVVVAYAGRRARAGAVGAAVAGHGRLFRSRMEEKNRVKLCAFVGNVRLK